MDNICKLQLSRKKVAQVPGSNPSSWLKEIFTYLQRYRILTVILMIFNSLFSLHVVRKRNRFVSWKARSPLNLDARLRLNSQIILMKVVGRILLAIA